ncbi:hypothetical protein D3C73_759250 [compost metagenome]
MSMRSVSSMLLLLTEAWARSPLITNPFFSLRLKPLMSAEIRLESIFILLKCAFNFDMPKSPKSTTLL